MKKILLSLWFIIFLLSFGFAQEKVIIKLNNNSSYFKVVEQSETLLKIQSGFESMALTPTSTKGGAFYNLEVNGLVRIYTEGMPNIPVYSKLIEIPQDAEVNYKIVSYDEQIIKLSDYNVTSKISPAQASVSKSANEATLPFNYNATAYTTNDYLNNDVVSVENVGTLRTTRFARIQINPIQYNPVKNEIKVLNNIVVEFSFDKANLFKTAQLKQKYASPYFNELNKEVINSQTLSSKNLITNSPVTYVIVSDIMFQAQLQPFVAWKKLKGFNVIEAYTNNPLVGNTTASIKTYLSNLYDNPETGVNAPSFVLFVGDNEQIPAWDGVTENHVTDLYYCDYTDDNIQDVFYGRFSAQTTEQLQPQIDKTLEYEKYLMPDPTYLGEVMMAAGADDSHQLTWGNGQINYGTGNYFNLTNDITSHTYLQPIDGNQASIDIRQNISDGVAYANYTAHCSPDGWADPGFSISQIAELTNAHKYGLVVGNCCQSNQFQDNCFGENILRAANKGAIGYIGGTNSTYWDEDYWWGVGLTSTITSNPTYENSERGAYDAMFHTKANETSANTWFITQSQMIVAGNLAVQSSPSALKLYYWEIYMLMGDPSIMPYLGVPEAITYSFNPNVLLIGSSSTVVNTVPYAYISFNQAGENIAVAMADENGVANVSFASPIADAETQLVITAQNKQPLIETVIPIAANAPYVLLNTFTPNHADYNSDVTISATLQNVATAGSGFNASNVSATLSLVNTDEFVTITDATANFSNINAGDLSTVADAFAINVADDVTDQHQVSFKVTITSGTDTWESNFKITLNAPKLEIGDMTISNDTNNDGKLDPAETATLTIVTKNIGHADIDAVVANLLGNSPYLTIINETTEFNVNAQGETEATFQVETNASSPQGTMVNLINNVEKGVYTAEATFNLVIGQLPIVTIGTGTTPTANYPFYTYYNNNKTQILYLGSEIGAGQVNIQQIAFDFAELGGTSLSNFKITMMPTTDTELTAFVTTTTATTVFDATNYVMPTATGWYNFDIDDYVFDGTGGNNLLIEIVEGVSKWESIFYKLNSTATTKNTVAYGYDDYVTPPALDGVSNERPNIKFFIEGEPAGSVYDITFTVLGNGKSLVTNAKVKVGSFTQNVDNTGEVLFNLAEGNYTYTATAPSYAAVSQSFSADATKNITIQLGNASSVKNVNNNFKIYPNPSNSLFNLQIDSFENANITIEDLSGRIILTQELTSENSVINLNNKAKGVYLIKLNIDNQIYNSKLILK